MMKIFKFDENMMKILSKYNESMNYDENITKI